MIFLHVKKIRKKLYFCFQNGFLTSNSGSWPNSSGGRLNSHQIPAYGSNFRSGRSPGLPFFDQCFLDFSILALLKSCFDKLDQEFSRCWSIPAKNHIISLKNCTCMTCSLFMFKFCLDMLARSLSTCWSILAKNHMISLKNVVSWLVYS